MLLRNDTVPVISPLTRPIMETLSKHFREITRAAFARHGFAQADVVTNWPEIVGSDLARFSVPERITWPRGTAAGTAKTGGTLTIRAAPGRALDLQYDASRIMARINSYFGYGAVVKLKVVTAPKLLPKEPPAQAPESLKPVHDQRLASIDDDSLRAALERLGQSVAVAAASSPQGK
jgi:hypothetical protein